MDRTNTARTQHAPHTASFPHAAAMRGCADGDLRVDVVYGHADLRALHGEWQQLWLHCAQATPFQSPAWLLPWAEHFAPDRAQALALRAAGRLCGLVPFFSWDNALLLAGTGPSDYGDGLFAEQPDVLAALALNELCAQAVALGCDRVDLQQLRPDSPLANAPLPPGWGDQTEPGTSCPVAPIQGEHGWDAVSPHWRKNARRAERLLQREFAVVFDDGDVSDDARELERLHGLRWGSDDATQAFSDPAMHAFLYAAIPALAQDGVLRLHRLLLDGHPAAIVFAMAAQDAHFFYMSGFDPQWSRYSTGLVTILHAMRCAAHDGATCFHFLRGSEAYKYHLGASDRPTQRRILRRLGSAA